MDGFVKFMERFLGMEDHGDEPRADMFLPDWLLIFGMILLLVGLVASIAAITILHIIILPIGIGIMIVGILAVLCWRNQTIRIISSTQFEYKTFMGRKIRYRFDEIRGIRENNDSMTLFVGNGKVHMESCAIFTQELADFIDEALVKMERVK